MGLGREEHETRPLPSTAHRPLPTTASTRVAQVRGALGGSAVTEGSGLGAKRPGLGPVPITLLALDRFLSFLGL